MTNRLHLFCDRIIEAGWLVALVVTPLYFNPASHRIFEADKIALLRSIAVLMAAAWLVKAVERGLARMTSSRTLPASVPLPLASGRLLAWHPLVLVVALFMASTIVATLFSALPRISFWGYYHRQQGLYTTAAYLIFFFSVLALLRTNAQVQRLITTVLLSSLPVALYGFAQRLNIDPLLWDTGDTVHSTMGNPLFLAATLSMIVPLTLYRLINPPPQSRSALRTGCYVLVLAVQGTCIFFSARKGPALGLITGLLVGGLLWMLARHWWRKAGFLALCSFIVTYILISVLTLNKLPGMTFSSEQEASFLDQLSLIADTTGQGRVLIWEGALDLITADPGRMAMGYGPETMRFVYYPHYSAELGPIAGWGVFPDRMHNETYDVLVTTGLIGFFLYLLLFTGIVYFSLEWIGLIAPSWQRNSFLWLWFLGGVGGILGFQLIGQTWAFSGAALPFGLLGGLVLYLVGYTLYASRKEHRADEKSEPQRVDWLLILLLVGILAHFVETNFGIAVSATRLLFWIYLALLMVLGVFFRSRPENAEASEVSTGQAVRGAALNRAGKRKTKSQALRRLPRGSMVMQGLVVGLMLVTFAYSLSMNSVSSESAVILGGFFAFTWLLAGGILLFETRPEDRKKVGWRIPGIYIGLYLLPLVVLFVFRKGDVALENNHLPLYYLFVFLVIGAIGFLLRPKTPSSRKTPFLGIVLALVGVLSALTFVYWTNIQPILADIHYRKAHTALELARTEQAVFHYKRALTLDPDQEHYQLEYARGVATIAHQIADITTREQFFLVAEDVLLRAVEANPYEQFLYRGLAEVYRLWAQKTPDTLLRAERYDQAFAALAEANQLIPENIPNWLTMAETYEEAGDRPLALETYNVALRLDSTNAETYRKLGALYQSDEAWSQAAAMYEGVLRYNKKPWSETYRALAVIYEQLGRLDEALRASKQAIALDPVALVHHELIGLYQRLGRCSEAQEQVRAALQRWPESDQLKEQAALLTRQCVE